MDEVLNTSVKPLSWSLRIMDIFEHHPGHGQLSLWCCKGRGRSVNSWLTRQSDFVTVDSLGVWEKEHKSFAFTS